MADTTPAAHSATDEPPFTNPNNHEPGSVDWYLDGLYHHTTYCRTCNPPHVDAYCRKGKAIRFGLQTARGRAAGHTGALL